MPIAAGRVADALDQHVAVRRSARAARSAPPAQAYSHSSAPSAGATLVTPAPLSSRICGDAVDRRSDAASCSCRRAADRPSAACRSRGRRRRACRTRRRSTTSSTTSGELAKPHIGHLPAGVGCHVARPHDRAGSGVERVQDAGRAERVHAAVAERRRAARTGAAVRFPEPHRVAVSPHRLARAHAVAGDDLVVAALLLRVEQSPLTAKDDQPGPIGRRHICDRRRRRPVGLDPHAADDAVAIGSAKARPLGGFHCCRPCDRDWFRRLFLLHWDSGSICASVGFWFPLTGDAGTAVAGVAVDSRAGQTFVRSCKQSFLCGRRPAPRELGAAADDSVGAKSIHAAHATKIAATIVTRRIELEERRVRTDQATKTGATTAGRA